MSNLPQRFRVKSPVRVDLAGGTLDLWPIHCVLGTVRTINCAISLSAFCDFEVEKAPVFRCEISSASGDNFQFTQVLTRNQVSTVPAGVRFPAFVVSEYLRRQSELPALNIKLHTSADFPLRSGLGGSSALGVGLARGMARIFSEFSEQGWQWATLHWIKDVEAAFLRFPTGTQDYLASLFGGLSSFVSQQGGIERVAFPEDVVKDFGARSLVLFSGEMHHSGLPNWEIYKRAFEGDQAIWDGLAGIQQISDQLDGELRGHVNWKYVGQLLSEEWRIRRETFKVQTSRLDEIIEFLKSKKVLGVKVCGAAQGGSLLALVDPAQKDKISSECRAQSIQVLNVEPERAPVTITPA